MDAALTREDILSLRPPVLELTLPGHERVSFRTLAVRDLDSLIARLDLSPVEFAVETLAGQAEDLPNAAALLWQLPRPTLLRLVTSWSAHPSSFNAASSQIRRFSHFKQIAERKVEELDRAFGQIREQFMDQFSSLAVETKKLFGAVSRIDHQLTITLSETWKAVAVTLDSAASKLEHNARELGKRGWTMPMWAPIDLLSDLAQVSSQQLDLALLRAYSLGRNEREKQLLGGLIDEPALLHWRPLLSECIYAYRRHKYRVIVPSLLTIVEGAVVSTRDLSLRKPSPKEIAAEGVHNRDPGLIRTAWASVAAFVEEVFGPCDFDASRPSLINRHWICHGRDVPEWGRIDCLRLFQALDTIATVHRQLRGGGHHTSSANSHELERRVANPTDRADGNRQQRDSRRSSA